MVDKICRGVTSSGRARNALDTWHGMAWHGFFRLIKKKNYFPCTTSCSAGGGNCEICCDIVVVEGKYGAEFYLNIPYIIKF